MNEKWFALSICAFCAFGAVAVVSSNWRLNATEQRHHEEVMRGDTAPVKT